MILWKKRFTTLLCQPLNARKWRLDIINRIMKHTSSMSLQGFVYMQLAPEDSTEIVTTSILSLLWSKQLNTKTHKIYLTIHSAVFSADQNKYYWLKSITWLSVLSCLGLRAILYTLFFAANTFICKCKTLNPPLSVICFHLQFLFVIICCNIVILTPFVILQVYGLCI